MSKSFTSTSVPSASDALTSQPAAHLQSIGLAPDTTPRSNSLLPGIAQTRHIVGHVLAFIISGSYYGWNPGVAFGWPSMAVAYALMTLMFWLLGCTIAELTCSLPFTGGPTTFAQAAFGQEASAVSALTITVACITGTAWAVTSLASYLVVIFNLPADATGMLPLLWLVLLQLFVLTNCRPVFFFRFSIAIASLCCLFLGIYVLCSLAHVSNIQPLVYTATSPTTLLSVLQAVPFAMFFYSGIEIVPLSAEECHNITRTAPRAIFISLCVLTGFSSAMLWLNCGLMPSVSSLISSNQVSLDSFFYQIGVALSSPVAVYASAAILVFPAAGWVHADVYGATRPVNATVAAAGIAFVWSVLLFCVLPSSCVAVLSQVTNWLLYVSYFIDFAAFIWLRYTMPQLPRPWKSPLGVPGAVVGALLSLLLGVIGPFALDAVTYGCILGGYLGVVLLFMVYFHLFAKQRLRNSPEKQFINAQLTRLYNVTLSETLRNRGRARRSPITLKSSDQGAA
ncbi:hypothetical protein RI367_006081 [Sorochytrium milnesiophthora]